MSHLIARLTTAFGVAALALSLLTASPVHAQVLTFEGLQDLEEVGDFYNGGTGSRGSSGTNYGISFSGGSLSLIDSDEGGSGNIANEPSGNRVLFFLRSPSYVMNVTSGFTDGFSFYYCSIIYPGSVNIYDGLNGTGNLLATLNLPKTPSLGQGDPTGQFDNWAPIGVTFSGTAKSVDFGGTANWIVYDNITIGSATPGNGGTDVPSGAVIPEAGTVALALPALGLIGAVALRRKK